MKNIILLAPQSAGKGTQAALIKEKYNIPHISTGDLLREKRKEKSEIGKIISSFIDNGALVPQDIIDKLLIERLNNKDCKNGFILDGYPRTIEQAKTLDKYLSVNNMNINYVINIDVSKEEIIKRITGRRICEKCATNYNINYESEKSKIENICDKCGGHLIKRSDDYEEAISKRLEIYYKEINLLLEFYQDKNILYKVDGCKLPNEVFKEIDKIINK